ERYIAVHSLIYDKYRVDEVYQVVFVSGFVQAARAAGWFDANVVDGLVNLMGKVAVGVAWLDGLVDTYIVDGAVNLVAGGVIASGREIRKVQTGRINNYVLVVTAGVVVIVIIAAYFA